MSYEFLLIFLWWSCAQPARIEYECAIVVPLEVVSDGTSDDKPLIEVEAHGEVRRCAHCESEPKTGPKKWQRHLGVFFVVDFLGVLMVV